MPRLVRVPPGGHVFHVIKRAQDRQWSSLHARLHGPAEMRELLSNPPIDLPRDWARQVNRPQTEAEEESILQSIRRGRPLGGEAWVRRTARRYDLQSTLRP